MSGPEERKFPRVGATLRVRSDALNMEGTSVDVSKGGMFVKTARYFPLNAVLRLTIDLPNGTAIPATCRVVFVRDAGQAKATGKPQGMGLEILDIPSDMKPMLDRLLTGKQSTRREAKPARASGRLNIVVVDDDGKYREMAAEPFRRRGDVVRTTSDGLEALAMCLKEPPDVILSDVQMPRMDGWQLLRLVRARPSLASVPVIFLTALDGDAERLTGYQLGVDAYIPKPYNPDELLIRVHQIVRRAKNARSSPTARTTMRGDLEHVSPSSLLSFLEMERKTGVLLLIGATVTRLFVRRGRVLRAEVEGEPKRNSKEVLMRILDWDNGQFEFAPQDVSGRDEVATAVTGLLLEHARMSDEQAR